MRTALSIVTAIWGNCSLAQDSHHDVFLLDAAGTKIDIARLTLSESGDYSLTMSDTAFTDHFLSMRPFRCLKGPEKHWCHVPYPYAIARNVSADFTDLEYDFLFIWKGATDYGIDTWNGIYYQIARDGDRLVGHAHEMDMGTLAVPPAAGDLRPIASKDLHETDPESHWLPVLRIEPAILN